MCDNKGTSRCESVKDKFNVHLPVLADTDNQAPKEKCSGACAKCQEGREKAKQRALKK